MYTDYLLLVWIRICYIIDIDLDQLMKSDNLVKWSDQEYKVSLSTKEFCCVQKPKLEGT